MNFLYPKFDKETHQTVANAANTSLYPKLASDTDLREITLPEGTKVSVIRENIGFDCNWALVKIIDKKFANNILFLKELYIPSKDLVSIGNKKTFVPLCSSENNIDPSEAEIDPNLKEILLPYVDKRNGLYSVRIQIDQERIVDNVLFENTLRDVYYEGINILLASRGFKSDNATIEELTNTFYTFGYINKDFDLTINRRCERLTFTVSIPLNFFNAPKEDRKEIPKATKFIRFSSRNFLTKINILIDLFSTKSADIIRLTYPDKIIENFIIDFEILFLKKFFITANNLFSGAGFPIKSDELTDFELGLTSDLDLLYIKVTKEGEESYLPNGFISQAKLLSSFYSKRVFNYLINFNSMVNEINNLEIYDFIIKYVKYPDAKLANATVIINNEVLPNEKLKAFNQAFNSLSEQCITLADVSGIIERTEKITNDVNTATDIVLADPLFHLYIDTLEDPATETPVEQFTQNLEFIKASKPSAEESKENKEKREVRITAEDRNIKDFDKKVAEDASKIDEQLSQGNEAALNALKQKYSFSAETLFYISNRINFNKFLFQHVFCYLKGLDPNSEEAKLITAETPELILRYFYYLYKNRNLKGKELVKALTQGLPINPNIFCQRNSGLVYFIKGLLQFVNGIKNFNIPEFVTQLKNFKENKTALPYKVYREALILEVESLTVDVLFQIISDLIEYSCDEDNLFNTATDDFRDPFNTHIPLAGFGGKKTNNDAGVINKNRGNVLNDVYSKELQLQYGFDSEFQIDLLNRLILDIRCILSPFESVNLLKGKPTPLVITLITNLIKNKYSKPPDDLSFLLVNPDKLKLFFQKLGLTIDKDFLEVLTPIIINGTSASDLCDPQQLEARELLIADKVPKNLGVLEDQLRRRATKARTIFDRIKNGQIEIPYNPFCPDKFGDEVAAANNFVLNEYYSQVRKIFESSLETFNNEVKKIPSVFEEPQTIYRRDQNGIFDMTDYKTYLSSLASNFKTGFNDLNKQSFFKFTPKLLEDKELSDLFLSERQIESLALGCDVPQTIKTDFYEFLDNPQCALLAEVVYVDRTFEDSSREEDDGINTLLDSDSATNLAAFLSKRKIIMAVTVDIDTNPAATNLDLIEFKIYYKDFSQSPVRYKTLANIKWESELVTNLFNELQQVGGYEEYNSDNFTDAFLETATNFNSTLAQTPLLGPAAAAAGFNWRDVNGITTFNDDSDTNDIAAFNSAAIKNVIDRKVSKIIETVYNKYFKKIVQEISNFEQINSYNLLLKKNGLFNIKRQLVEEPFGNKKIIHKIDVSSVLNDSGKIKIDQKNFITFEQSVDPDHDEKFMDKLGIAGELGFSLEKKYFKSYTTAYEYSISKWNETLGQYFEEKEIEYDEDFKETYLQNSQYKLFYKNESNAVNVNFNKYSLYDYPKDARFYACNITPHYFNIDRLLANSLDVAKTEICNGFDNILDDIIKEIAVNLLFRTFITDLLIKAVPFLTTLKNEKLNNLHKENFYVNALKAFMFRDLEIFGGFDKQNNTFISTKYFIKAATEVFQTYKEKRKLNPSFNLDNDPINYFIRKEIRHFIKYSIDKGIFKSNYRESSFSLIDNRFVAATNDTEYKPYLATDPEYLILDGDFAQYYNPYGIERQNRKRSRELNLEYDLVLAEKYKDIVSRTYDKFYDSYFLCFIMASTIDFEKRSLFFSTKQQLLNILFSAIQLDPASPEDSALINQFSSPSQEDVIKFISDLASSNTPALLIQLKPQYSKYLIYFLEQLIINGRRIALTVAEASDKNIFLTRRINTAISYVQSLIWSLAPSQTRDTLIAESTNPLEKIFWKRLESGKSIIPDALVSLNLIAKGFPLSAIGSKYLFFDSISEGIWVSKALQDIRQSSGVTAEQEPCALIQNIPENASQIFVCSPENKIALIKETDSYEEP